MPFTIYATCLDLARNLLICLKELNWHKAVVPPAQTEPKRLGFFLLKMEDALNVKITSEKADGKKLYITADMFTVSTEKRK